jgi:hypothetical protein
MDERTVYVATEAGEDTVRAAVRAWLPRGFTDVVVEFEDDDTGIAVDLYSPVEPDPDGQAGLDRSIVRLRNALRATLPYRVELDDEVDSREMTRSSRRAG